MRAEGTFNLTARLVVGLGVLALGAIILLDNLRLLDADEIFRYWPLALIALGLAKLLLPGGGVQRLVGLVVALVGVWFLLEELRLLPDYIDLGDLWPVALVAVGVALVLGALRGPGGDRREVQGPVVNAFALMGGNSLANKSKAFSGANVGALMGACELDLRAAEPASEGAIIDAFAFWGGVDIQVPEGWAVTSKVLPLMGGYEDKTRPVPAVPGKHLTVKGLAVMGGIEVSNGPGTKSKA